MAMSHPYSPLIDSFGRQIRYLRLSVTDRCDLRCVYCMKAQPDFLPKSELLSLEELEQVAGAFIARGVRKIRITGGEPLVRRDVVSLIERLGARLGQEGGLEELTLTTNATQLPRFAERLAAAGMMRINVSLDTLDAGRFSRLTRGGRLADTLTGIAAAKAAGLKVKINAVAMKGENEDELPDLIAWAHGQGHDITLIEVMPIGDVGTDRSVQFLPLSAVRDRLDQRWTLTPLDETTGGPARYHHVAETGGKLGLITPLTGNFCAGCNRVRLTCTGQLHACLGQEGSVDLRGALREHGVAGLHSALEAAVAAKPEAHDFDVSPGAKPSVTRHMAITGG
ncbi:cyclic pyranopterin phosphate synthase MoaA [Maricaulis sp. W15]|uniref:GTP 3',8-cyclase MoaA n=1 Tax=Maricaulis sp. W15 TaxID=1772333 RepID=UPI000948BC2E|nr:GTP 3',8-cyclase MoaA [Maricaulis sp. W15]OLF81147.1 cyclic pyranopterin phosphate synthase MoaA [Maricaulis sp. W15]